MTPEQARLAYVLRLADNTLVLAQRMIESVTLMPELEDELANANFALDYLGQARMLYSYAAELETDNEAAFDEDHYAFRRNEAEFRNVLLVEQPHAHFGDALARVYLFEVFHGHLLEALTQCGDERLAEIAARAAKEVAYHVKHSAEWVVRLGDGTDLSRERIQASVDHLWQFTGELFVADAIDTAMQTEIGAPDLEAIRALWAADVARTLKTATLQRPQDGWMQEGGKQGHHSEHLGYLLAEMQHLHRSHAGATW